MCPIYDFECLKCDKPFEIVQGIKEHTGKAECPACGNTSTSQIISSKIQFIGAKVEDAEYNPAFGQVVKNSRHRNELAKARGLVEIGNESPDKMHKAAEKTRVDNIKKSWDDV